MWRVVRYIDGKGDVEDREVVAERSLQILVDGQPFTVLECSPDEQLEALVLGFLFNEGVIAKLAEVLTVEIVNNQASVRTNKPDTGKAHLEFGPPERVGAIPGSYQPPGSDKNLDCLQVTKLMLEMSRASEAYREHGGIHTSALSEGEMLLVVAEDVGKLNTIDKIMGECLKRGIEPDGKILMSSGRITSKMLLKAARMRIPILLSRSSPTSLAVEWADRLGLTLVGYARGNSCRVYTHEYRIKAGG